MNHEWIVDVDPFVTETAAELRVKVDNDDDDDGVWGVRVGWGRKRVKIDAKRLHRKKKEKRELHLLSFLVLIL